jgi:hypothetical protein
MRLRATSFLHYKSAKLVIFEVAYLTELGAHLLQTQTQSCEAITLYSIYMRFCPRSRRRIEGVGIAPPFKTSTLIIYKWSAACPWRTASRVTVPGTHWKSGWVGFRGGLDTTGSIYTSCFCRESNPNTPVVQPTL